MDNHLTLLMAVNSLKFNVGKRLLVDILKGNITHKIKKLKLDKTLSFGSLCLMTEQEIEMLIEELMCLGYLKYGSLPNKAYIKVFSITDSGKKAVKTKKLKKKKKVQQRFEQVTEKDKVIFRKLGPVLKGLTDEQKKCVVEQSQHILCIAGAGTGKTKVLTKRVWFLSNFRNVEEDKILAVTFTRKARTQMRKRIRSPAIHIETFNSFCEKILRKNHSKYYSKSVDVLDFRKRIKLVNEILSELKITKEAMLSLYYDNRKLRSEDPKILYIRFMNDLFSALDYRRYYKLGDNEFYRLEESYAGCGKLIKKILQKIRHKKKEKGLRDFTDQIVHCIDLFKNNPDLIPQFNHVLVDEYQDVNNLQIELIDLLNPKNLFVVGDPRQSIFGWRGSRIKYILDFSKKYPDAKVLSLTKNFRSSDKIVDVCNAIISPMRLPDLKGGNGKTEAISLINHDTESAENIFIAQSILTQEKPRNEIFVLARTNRELEKLSRELDRVDIKYIKRTVEESKSHISPDSETITLSTIHAIKGLEADVVYVKSVDSHNFPIKVREHPLLEAVKVNEDYDKYNEELRLLYVALSRAKNQLIINYHAKLSHFFNSQAMQLLNSKRKLDSLFDVLREWRNETANILRKKPYHILNDRTILQICEFMPTNRRELSEIYGMSPVKLKKFGDQIIELVNTYS